MCPKCNNNHWWTLPIRYAEALVQWLKAGRPTRTASEIIERWEICKRCEHFEEIEGKPWRGKCQVCGCYLGRHTRQYLSINKIAMRTEKCPENKWD